MTKRQSMTLDHTGKHRPENAAREEIERAIAMVRGAVLVFVWCPITHEEGEYFRVTKAEAIWRLENFGSDRLGDGKIRIRKDGGDVYIA